MVRLPFQDRAEAGRSLASELAKRNLAAKRLVLALPRGGVPVAAEVAEALKAPLDVVVVRKIGVPWQPELGVGAIAGETSVLDFRMMEAIGLSREEVESVIERETKELQRRERLYRNGRRPLDVRDCTVVLVDDGLATGSTMLAAVRHVRAAHPKRLIVAVPVGSSEACKRIGSEGVECVCLATPEPFSAVGEWYVDFGQTSDAEVQEILERFSKDSRLAPALHSSHRKGE